MGWIFVKWSVDWRNKQSVDWRIQTKRWSKKSRELLILENKQEARRAIWRRKARGGGSCSVITTKLYHTIPHNTILYQYHAIPYYTNTMLYHTISGHYHTILYYTMPYHTDHNAITGRQPTGQRTCHKMPHAKRFPHFWTLRSLREYLYADQISTLLWNIAVWFQFAARAGPDVPLYNN